MPRMGETVDTVPAVELGGDRYMAAEIAPTDNGRALSRPRGGLSLSAWAFLVLIAVGAALPTWFALPQIGPLSAKEWAAFALIALGAALAQMFPVVTPRDQSYHTTMVVLVPAALLLPTWLLPAVVLAQHLPEWLKLRYPWYIQTFNASNYLVDLFAAAAVGRYVLQADVFIGNRELKFAIAGFAAAVVLVILNHLILSVMLRLGRGHSVNESGLFSFENLSTELVLAALGVLVAYSWLINPALIPFAIAPLLLIHRSLAVPLLEQEARLDPKTGLFNVRHFSAVLNEKLELSVRTGQPLALLMIDLDLLREINNTYGHLAGDAILERIADVFRSSLRADDIAARFGGEEFVVLLPDTEAAAAFALAERIRETIGRQRVPIGEIGEVLSATVSIGVSMCPRDGTDTAALIHRADLAVYRAKIQGRNRVVDGVVQPLGELEPNSEWWGPKPKSTPQDADAAEAATAQKQLDEAASRAIPDGPQGRPPGVVHRARADRGRRLCDLCATAVGHGRAALAGRSRRRRPGPRTPGRGGRRLGRRRRRARGRSAHRRRRRGGARPRCCADRCHRPASSGLHLDLQPREC